MQLSHFYSHLKRLRRKFPAGYYGLFGEGIFQDFELKFLRKDIQSAIAAKVLFDPVNRFRLASGTFSRSDI